MKKICKKMIVFLMVVVMVVTSGFSCAVAQEATLDELASKIQALPKYEDFSAVTNQGFEKAVNDAWQLIEEMAALTDEELDSLENSTKVFDLYVGLSVMKLKQAIPNEVPTKDQLVDQVKAIMAAGVTNTDLIAYLCEFTSVYEGEDPEYTETLGDTLLAEMSNELMEFLVRVAATTTTLTEEEKKDVLSQIYSLMLDLFPTTFTVENFWDYAYDYYELVSSIPQEEVNETVWERIQTLGASFDALVLDERPTIIAELEKRIDAVCNVEEATNASYLGLVLYHMNPCDDIGFDIELLGTIYEEDPYTMIRNYEVYDEYCAIVYAYSDTPVPDDYLYGDLDWDGDINAKDALIVLKMSVNKIEYFEFEFTIGDVDGNGDLNAIDALYILKYSVNKIEYFPVEEYLYVG